MFWKCSEIIILLYCFSELVKHHLRMKVMCFDRKPCNYGWLGEIVSRMLFSRSRMNIELHNLVWQKKTSVQLLFPKLRNKNLVLVTKTITQIKSIFSHRSRGHNLINWGVIYKWSVWEQLIRTQAGFCFRFCAAWLYSCPSNHHWWLHMTRANTFWPPWRSFSHFSQKQ